MNSIMSSKKALKQAQKQRYAKFKDNYSLNKNDPFNRRKQFSEGKKENKKR